MIKMIGKRFDRLTVVEEAGRRKGGQILWRCVCECGNETIVDGTSLRSGHTNSCGCYKRECVSEKNKIDITGQTFGRLTAVEEAGRDKQGMVLWKCRCDCGNETVVVGMSLRNGDTKSCGCYRREHASERQLGRRWEMEVRIRISCSGQGINREDWDGFVDDDWRDWSNVTYINEPFSGCHRHHLTKTLVACIPSELHGHIPHCLKTGYNMGETNMLALQFINGEL